MVHWDTLPRVPKSVENMPFVRFQWWMGPKITQCGHTLATVESRACKLPRIVMSAAPRYATSCDNKLETIIV